MAPSHNGTRVRVCDQQIKFLIRKKYPKLFRSSLKYDDGLMD